MIIITLDGKGSFLRHFIDMEQAEIALERRFGLDANPLTREYNFKLGNETFFKMPNREDVRLVSMYEVDVTKPIYYLVMDRGWTTFIHNDFELVLDKARQAMLRSNHRGVKNSFQILDDAGIALVGSK